MNALDRVGPKEPPEVLTAQVRRASEVLPQDLAEAEKLVGLVAGQLRSAGLDRAVGLHRISPLKAVGLTED